MRWATGWLLGSWLLGSPIFGAGQGPDRARAMYDRAEYRQSLDILLAQEGSKGAPALQLIGQDEFMLGEYKKSTDALEKAALLDRDNAEILHWLGRAYGRRAETGNPFTAPGHATKARQMFEKSVEIDPTNKEAVNDLF